MDQLLDFVPTVVAVLGVVAVLALAHWVMEKIQGVRAGRRFQSALVMLVLTLLGFVVIILSLPIGDTRQGQLLSLFGIVLSAAVGLSATNFLGNTIAGFMLRGLRAFRIGDFIRCGDHFGRVTEQGLVHTEIQTEDSDLTTLPNLYLISNPVTTVRASGTIVSATVSLGYDIPRGRIEACLIEAAEATELADPFVQVLELGDFSVHYRVAGLLTEVKQLLTVRSKLRANVMDALHGARIEIVSPSFMNQRVFDPRSEFIPATARIATEPAETGAPEAVVFDKADEAESLEKLRITLAEVKAQVAELKAERKKAQDDAAREVLDRRLERLSRRQEALEQSVASRENGDETRA
jgi:small-conductance mechanosensitive channel